MMSKIINFIKECGVFFVLTMNDDSPAGRPFGAIMESGGDLFISTSDVKDVYKQLKNHPKMQIISLKNGTRNWMRINGTAEECFDIGIKQKMLVECPILTKHFPTPDVPHFSVFRVNVENVDVHQ